MEVVYKIEVPYFFASKGEEEKNRGRGEMRKTPSGKMKFNANMNDCRQDMHVNYCHLNFALFCETLKMGMDVWTYGRNY